MSAVQKKENAPLNQIRPTRQDGTKAEEDQYQGELDRMRHNELHKRHHYDPKINTKVSRAQQDHNSAAAIPDKFEVLRDENLHLRSTHNNLQEQVRIIHSKLQRQISNLSKGNIIGGLKNSVTAQFESDLDHMIEDDIKLQEEERILMMKVKKLQAKRRDELQEGKNLYSVAEEHQMHRKNTKAEQDQLAIINTLKTNIDRSNKQIIGLKQNINGLEQTSDTTLSSQELQGEKRQVSMKLMQTRSRLEDVRANIRVKEDIFKEGQGYEKQLFKSLKLLQDEQTDLHQQQRSMESAAAENTDFRARLIQIKGDRDRMQADFDSIMRQPFFNQQSDKSNLKQLELLQQSLDQKERDILKMKTAIQQFESETTKMQGSVKSINSEASHFQEEINKMKSHMDPGTLTIDDIMMKLRKADPTKFRDAMNDLAYEGQDPNWYQMQYMEQLNMLTGSTPLNPSDVKSLRHHRDRLMEDKAKLATELSRIQNLLRLQVDIDKQNSQLLQAEMNQVQSHIRQNNLKTKEVQKLIANKAQNMVKLQSAVGPTGLTKGDLDKFNQNLQQLKKESNEQDQMSEFSIITDESEIMARENRLDLRVSTASFDRVSLMQLMGGREVTPGQVRTFLAIDFYNHDSKHTDQSEGFEPIYNTLFSFKNTVDDFYLKHLEKSYILVDVFGVPPLTVDNKRANGAIKIGSAKLPLHKLIEGDFSFQAQEIIHETSQGSVKVGKLFFRMRMRKPLDQALKWYNQAKQLQQNQQDTVVKLQAHQSAINKMISISVVSASNLTIQGTFQNKRMMPFFSYDFYTFEYRSATVQGCNPEFQSLKQFQVEANPQFLQYMKTQVLVIDLIDESVDMTQVGQRDYIGSIRIPLREVVIKGGVQGTFTVIDENRKQCGELVVQIQMTDLQPGEVSLDDSMRISSGSKMQLETLKKICYHFAKSQLELEMIFDMLFTKDTSQSQRVSKLQLKQFLLEDLKIQTVLDRDIDVLFKTHPILCDRDLLDRQDLIQVFEKATLDAKERTYFEQSGLPAQYSKQQSQLIKTSGAFGTSSQPSKPVQNPFEDTQQAFNKADTAINTQKLETKIQDQLYQVLNKFADVCGVDYPGATKKQSIQVFTQQLQATDKEAEVLFDRLQINNLLFYKDCLSSLYGKQTAMPATSLKRTQTTKSTLTRIKKRILEYMIVNNYNVDELFAILKSKKEQDITQLDFAQSMSAKVKSLTPQDLQDLFQAIDTDKSGSVSLIEIQAEFADVNVAMVLKDIKDSQMDLKKVIQTVDTSGKGQLGVIQFAELISLGSKQASKSEVDLLFRVVDTQNKGYLTQQDLQAAFSNIESVLDSEIKAAPKDLFMPLLYKVKNRLNLNGDAIYHKFKNEKQKVDLNSMTQIFKQFLGIQLDKDELATVEAMMVQYFKSSELTISDVNALFMMQWKHNSLGQGNEAQSLKTLAKIKSSLKKPIDEVLELYQYGVEVSNKDINLRSFKQMLRQEVRVLEQYDTENLVQWLDPQSTGFISTVEFKKNL